DETAHVIFNAEDAKIFSSETNNRSEDIRLVITRHNDEEVNRTLSSYDVKPVGAVTGAEIKDIKIAKPTVQLQFRYTVGINGAPKSIRAALRSFTGSPKDVGIFWNNTVEYVK